MGTAKDVAAVDARHNRVIYHRNHVTEDVDRAARCCDASEQESAMNR